MEGKGEEREGERERAGNSGVFWGAIVPWPPLWLTRKFLKGLQQVLKTGGRVDGPLRTNLG
jgi:hypothetical protein